MSDADEKAALYRQLVTQSDPWLVLERMRSLGFWPEDEEVPDESAAAKAERERLEDELVRLRKQGVTVANPEAALAKERVRRWQESKKRRALAKVDREAQQKARATAWAEQRATTIVHAGDGVSGGLQDRQSDVARLAALGLPELHTVEQLAAAAGLTLARLRWLTYHRKSVTLVHYHRYAIPKKTGGVRHISAPKTALADAQRWILDHVLVRVPPSSWAHGFVAHRSTITNASPHTGRKVVMNLDLENFFPTLDFRRIKGVFRRLGYSESVATTLALLTTEPPRTPAQLDGRVHHVALGERVLPQGACTSPALTNIVCRRLDARLAGLARKFEFVYTRYADDLTFSGDELPKLGALLGAVRRVITAEGFVENAAKTRIMHRGRRQEVTGLVVNERVGLSRTQRRRLRAILHNCAKTGIAAQNREEHPRFRAWLEGMIAYVQSVDPRRAVAWRNALALALKGSDR
ncbi:MAG TPA: reverse transcriptase family protein [Nannocystaceae bacterium]|nr:reverse transcriptase family protein [Nannocystaceae bacterium]